MISIISPTARTPPVPLTPPNTKLPEPAVPSAAGAITKVVKFVTDATVAEFGTPAPAVLIAIPALRLSVLPEVTVTAVCPFTVVQAKVRVTPVCVVIASITAT